MKFFIAVVFVALAVAVQSAAIDEAKELYKKHKAECVEETKVSPDLVKKAKEEGIFSDDEKLQDYFLCFAKKSAFINDAGEYQKDHIREKLTQFVGEETVTKFIDECLAENKGDAKANAVQFAKCFHKYAPKHHEEEKKH